MLKEKNFYLRWNYDNAEEEDETGNCSGIAVKIDDERPRRLSESIHIKSQ